MRYSTSIAIAKTNLDCAIFDIDGVLADCTHRLHFIDRPTPDWESFFSAVDGDTPIHHNLKLMRALSDAGIYIALLTGRNERTRTLTNAWFAEAQCKLGEGYDDLLMRFAGDYRPDYVIKREMLNELRAKGLNVFMAFDDRQIVVDMFTEEGVPCHLIKAPDAKKMELVKHYEKAAEGSGEANPPEAETQSSC